MCVDAAVREEVEFTRVDEPSAGFRQCPVCGSWETTRHAEAFRVWFTCNRCGAVFG